MPSGTFFPTDSISGAREIIDPSHESIHDGRHFTATHSVSVGTATAVTVLFKTPPASEEKYIHFTCSVEADKAVDWTFSEAPNASGGTTLVAHNNNRRSENGDPLTSLAHTATYVSAGTVLEGHIMGTNQPATKLGGEAEARNEWDLEVDTFYLVRGVALAADTKVNIIMPYYYRTEG